MVEKELFNMNVNPSDGDGAPRSGEEEVDRNSESDNSYVNSNENHQQKRKRYHRHTPHQIQEMEAFFKECPHPDDRQRKELSRELGMEPLQVKFWFQNKRTQMKTQHEHQANAQLRAENEKLRSENMRYREALSNASCPTCGGPTPIGETTFHEHQLRLENARLREEIDHISAIATKYVGKPFTNGTDIPSSSTQPHVNLPGLGSNAGSYERYKQPAIVEMAVAAMEELIRMGQLGEPLWMPSLDRHSTVLNEEEYLRSFSRVFGPKPIGFISEATRETVVVSMSAVEVVEILMDVEKWSNVFSGVISRATNLQMVAPGAGGDNYNDALQVMNAEYHVLSPLVPTRENYFVRHCKQHVDGTWIVADVSLDHFQSAPLVTCRRRPSGCVIQDVPKGCSKVIWVEHVDVQNGGIHSIYKPLIAAGLGFGAKRWVSILEGYCQRVTKILEMKSPPCDANVIANEEGRKSLSKLAERMVSRFCGGVSSSIVNAWTTLSGNDADNVKVMTRKNVDDPTMPFGVHLSIATSFWLSTPPKRVFDYLRNYESRKEWDMLSMGDDVHEMEQILTGNEPCNNITLYQSKGTSSSQTKTIMLQESRSDPTACYVVYAPMDMVCVNTILGGGDPSYLPLLPSGFAILPDGPANAHGRGTATLADSGGSLMTVALQILIDSNPNAKLSLGSIAVANNLLSCTVDKIKRALVPKAS